MAALFQDQVGMARENMSGATGASVCVASLPDPLVQSGRGVNALVPASSSVVNNVIAINIDNGGPDNSAAVANFFSTNPTPLTFTIKKGSLAGRITSLNLRFQVTGSATPAVLLPTFMWFSKIVVKCNDGQRELETYANQLEVMLDFCHNLKSAKMQRWAPQHNVNTDLTQKGAIAVGNNNFVLSLKNTLLNSIGLNPSLLKGDVQIILTPAPFSQLATTGAVTDAVMTAINLYVNLEQYNSYDNAALVQRFNSGSEYGVNKPPIVYPFLSPRTYMPLSAISITQGVPINFNLGNTPDYIAGMYICAVDSRQRAQDWYNTVDFSDATFQFQDTSNGVLQSAFTGSYLAYDVNDEKNVEVFMNSTNPVRFWPVFCVYRNYDNIDKGQIDGGFFEKTGTDRITITPATTLANTYNIYVLILSYRTAKLQDGVLSAADQ